MFPSGEADGNEGRLLLLQRVLQVRGGGLADDFAVAVDEQVVRGE